MFSTEWSRCFYGKHYDGKEGKLMFLGLFSQTVKQDVDRHTRLLTNLQTRLMPEPNRCSGMSRILNHRQDHEIHKTDWGQITVSVQTLTIQKGSVRVHVID
jgi:hypothetical protein